MPGYDFIIVGAGAAGRSLAYHLAHSPLRDAAILLVGARIIAIHPRWRLSDPVGHLRHFVDAIVLDMVVVVTARDGIEYGNGLRHRARERAGDEPAQPRSKSTMSGAWSEGMPG